MRVVRDKPPIYDTISSVFDVADKPVIFAWGDIIYNPSGTDISPALHAHEEVHGERQRACGVEEWWKRYLADPAFRLAEEVPAHQAEFNMLCELNADKWISKRSMRRTFAAHIAKKLAAPLYGSIISAAEAKKLILTTGAVPD